jgi:tRNA-dihydrouridine synthase C
MSDFLKRNQPAVILAPMEGVTDAPFRDFITRSGGYDYCVSEFIRVSSHSLPSKVFPKEVPELKTGGRTRSGIPVQVQILGGNAERMAESARNAVEAGARGIDINFGCPAPTVNRHDGGATLLQYPERIEQIVRAIRDAVPSDLPVSAKLRLGFADPNAIYENARRVEQGGASWITIHGRTKTQGYIPPAYWKPIGAVAHRLSIPVVANGEIWSMADFKRCAEETGCIHFMIGRGALAVPGLAVEMRKALGLAPLKVVDSIAFPEPNENEKWAELFREYGLVQPSEKRLKQWARYLHSKGSIPWWDEIKGLESSEEILIHLMQRSAARESALKVESHLSQIEP